MPELTADDVASFTNGRLPADDEATERLLKAALAAARRYCGWSVSPVVSVTHTMTGEGGRVLSLPTLQLVSIESLSESGVAVDVSRLDFDPDTGMVEKFPAGSWSRRRGGITAAFTHGFDEDAAADFREGVLQLVDMMSRIGARDNPDLKRKKVDDVEYEWFEGVISTDRQLAALFAPFRILPAP